MTSLAARLDKFGLGKYAELFARNDVDLDVLADLTDSDLEKLGVSLGDRRRILKLAGALAGPAIPATSRAESSRELERRQLTVMFADLVGSTTLAARYDPEVVQTIIADYQKAVAGEVARFGGYVAKSLGDGLLIYFGWPQAHEDDAERALGSAIAAVASVGKVSSAGGARLAVRIGVATGEVLVGDIVGAEVTESGAVVGETPNLAARLQSLARENAIVVSERTMKLAGRQFTFVDLGEQTLKGYDAPVRAWRLEGEHAPVSRFEARHGTRLGKFVGRDHEIGLLTQRWEEALDGECQLVLISGEAGIGKSRLVSEATRRVEMNQRIVYQASPLHTNTPLYPVVRQLESWAGFAAGDSPAERFRKLAAVIAQDSLLDRVALGYLADLMSLTPGDSHAGELRPAADLQREAALDALVSTVESAAKAGPLLIVVEDAHWLDATTQELVERLLGRLQRRPVMLLVTYRPEFVPPWAQHGNVGLLSLSRLGRRHALAIANSLVVEGRSLAPEVAEAIVEKSDGVPLFVEELAGSLLDSAADGKSVQIPSSLRDSLAERLDKLGSAKEVAQIAAAFGREFSLDLIAAAMTRPEASLSADLGRLLDIDVVFQSSRSDRRFVFKHALLQDAAYQSLPKSRRREIHARIAKVLIELRPGIADTEAEVLANHFEHAGNITEAATQWRKAGRISLQNSAYREAIGAFSKALSFEPEGKGASRERSDTNRAIATAYFAVADIGSVRRHLDQALRDAAAIDDKVLTAEIATQQCHVLNIFGGRMSDARQAGERALSIATELGDEQLAYGTRFALGQACWVAGEAAAGIVLLTANLPENLGDEQRVRDFGTAGSLLVDSIATLGACHGFLGEFDRAMALFRQGREVLRQITPTAFDRMVVESHPARTLVQRGDFALAIPLLEQNRALCVEAGLRFSLPWQTGFLGYARVLAGEREVGISLLREALQDCPGVYFATVLQVRLAEAMLDLEPDAALKAAKAALLRSRELGYRATEAEALRVTGAALEDTDTEQAEARVFEALALARALGLRPEEAHALRALRRIQSRLGRDRAAEENRELARTIYRALGMDYWLRELAA